MSGIINSIFGGSSSGSGAQQTSSQADPRVVDAYLNNISRTNQVISALPAQQYAGFTPDQQASFDIVRQNATSGVGQNVAAAGIGTALQAAAYTPKEVSTNFSAQNIGANQFKSEDIKPGQFGTSNINNSFSFRAIDPSVFQSRDINGGSFLDRNISAYMNPYLNEVAGNTLTGLDRARQMVTDNNAAAAVRNGAFGGSRQGVVDAETNRGFFDTASRSLADLYAGGYNAATTLAGQDLARELAAQQANQQAALAAQAQRLSGMQSNQQAGLTTNAQRLAADQANQNAGLRVNDQRLSALQANQQSAIAAQAQQLAALQANQQAAAQAEARRLAAEQANQQAAAQAAQLQLAAANQLGTLGSQYQTIGFQDAAALGAIGGQQQELLNQQLNADRNNLLTAAQLSNAAVGTSPSGFSTSSSGSTQGKGLFETIFG